MAPDTENVLNSLWVSTHELKPKDISLRCQSALPVERMGPSVMSGSSLPALSHCKPFSKLSKWNFLLTEQLSKKGKLRFFVLNCVNTVQFIQSLSCVWLFSTPWTSACQASLSLTNSRSLPKPMFIESVMPSNHLILCRPLLFLSSIFPSIRVFSDQSALHIWWPKYWSFSFNISPSSEHPGLISFKMDWLDLLAVQGTLKSLLQHHSSKASILRHSAFFIVQLSHPYMTTGKTIALTRWTFVDSNVSAF